MGTNRTGAGRKLLLGRSASRGSGIRRAVKVVWICGVLGAISMIPLALLTSESTTVTWTFAVMLASCVTAFLSVGALIVSRQPTNRIGLLFMAEGLLLMVGVLLSVWSEYGLLHHAGSTPLASEAAWAARILTPVALGLFIPIFLLFPDGRSPSPRWRPVVWIWAAGMVIALFGWITGVRLIVVGNGDTAQHTSVSNPTYLGTWADAVAQVGGFLLFGTALATVAALIVRYRRARGDERQQVRWLMVVGVSFLVAFLFQFVLAGLLHDEDLNGPAGSVIFLVYTSILLLGLPVAAGVAILKYHLYELDVVVRKTVIATVLTLFVAGAYVAIVTVLGALTADALVWRVVATAFVAIAFQPVRERATRLANRIVYGHRATPYDVLARFSERVGGTYATDDILVRTARVIAEGTGAERAEIWLHVGDGLQLASSWPENAAARTTVPVAVDEMPPLEGDRTVPVRLLGELLGAMVVTKPAGEPITPGENKLLDDLAGQAGLVLSNVRLTADLEARLALIDEQARELRASRQRIVVAQDEERRRLERDIHDGAQQHLVALAVKLRLVRGMLAKDPAKAHDLSVELRAQVDDALDTLNALALGIYPPLLEEQGIAPALALQYTRSGLPVRMQTDGVGRYAIEFEAAVYFCVLEALQNAAKYAQASQITIRLQALPDELAFEIVDDGTGFDVALARSGTGLAGMRDRLAVLGGDVWVSSTSGAGTTVRGSVPLLEGAGSR